MKIEELKQQFTGRKFGELVLHHQKRRDSQFLLQALRGTMQELSNKIPVSEFEILIDLIFLNAYDEAFWRQDCGDALISITNYINKKTPEYLEKLNDDDLLNGFNIIVLNFAYAASLQPGMKTFIRNSVYKSFFEKIRSRFGL